MDLHESLGPFFWRSTVVLLAAFALNAIVFRRAPVQRHAVLLLALLSLPLLWFSAQLEVSWPRQVSRAELGATAAVTSPRVGIEQAQPPWIESLPAATHQWNRPARWISGQLATPATIPARGWDPLSLLWVVWLVGSLGFVASRMRSVRARRALLRRAQPCTDARVQAGFEGLAKRLGAPSPVSLLLVEGPAAPACTGILRPVILLPADLLEGGGGERLDSRARVPAGPRAPSSPATRPLHPRPESVAACLLLVPTSGASGHASSGPRARVRGRLGRRDRVGRPAGLRRSTRPLCSPSGASTAACRGAPTCRARFTTSQED